VNIDHGMGIRINIEQRKFYSQSPSSEINPTRVAVWFNLAQIIGCRQGPFSISRNLIKNKNFTFIEYIFSIEVQDRCRGDEDRCRGDEDRCFRLGRSKTQTNLFRAFRKPDDILADGCLSPFLSWLIPPQD